LESPKSKVISYGKLTYFDNDKLPSTVVETACYGCKVGLRRLKPTCEVGFAVVARDGFVECHRSPLVTPDEF
jgi:hypothetical protein